MSEQERIEMFLGNPNECAELADKVNKFLAETEATVLDIKQSAIPEPSLMKCKILVTIHYKTTRY